MGHVNQPTRRGDCSACGASVEDLQPFKRGGMSTTGMCPDCEPLAQEALGRAELLPDGRSRGQAVDQWAARIMRERVAIRAIEANRSTSMPPWKKSIKLSK